MPAYFLDSSALLKRYIDEAGSYDIAMLSVSMTDNTMQLAVRHLLRSYDAIQLASALFVAERAKRISLDLAFVCADAILNRAAAMEGLIVENPNDHP